MQDPQPQLPPCPVPHADGPLGSTLTPHCPSLRPRALRRVIEEIITGWAKWHVAGLPGGRDGGSIFLEGPSHQALNQLITDSSPAGRPFPPSEPPVADSLSGWVRPSRQDKTDARPAQASRL